MLPLVKSEAGLTRRSGSAIFCLAFLSVLLFSGFPSAASTWKGEELRRRIQQTPWRVLFFRLQPVIYIRNAGYDSNVYHGGGENQVEDYTATAGPGMTVYFNLRRKLVCSASGSAQYVYFLETKRERTWNFYGQAEVALLLNRFFLSFGGLGSDARERWNTEIDIRPSRLEKGYYGELLWQITPRLSASLSGKRVQYDYENLFYERFNLRDRLNRTEDYFNLTLHCRLNARAMAFFDFEAGFFEFTNPASGRDSRSRAAYFGVEFSPFARIRGRLKLGYKFFDSLNEARKDFKGWVGDTSLSLRLGRRLALRAVLRRDVRFSLWYDNTFFIENFRSAGATTYLWRLRFDYDYGQGQNRYPGSRGLEVAETRPYERRRDDFFIHSVGVYFRLRKNMAVGLVGQRWRRDSTLPWENATRDFFGLNLTYDF